MGPALFAITLESMKSEVDEVALQGKLMNFYLPLDPQLRPNQSKSMFPAT